MRVHSNSEPPEILKVATPLAFDSGWNQWPG